MINENFSAEAQFRGFVATPQIFTKNDIFEYPLYPTSAFREKSTINITNPTSTVLGKRMEDLFAVYITQFTSEEILLQNRQIILNKETLGEIDFLLKDNASGVISHVELIYKFYLYDPDTGISETDHLIGPNKRDSLNRKLERLQKRQFPLLFQEATQELLKTLKINPEEVIQKMCFKANIFLPKQMRTQQFSEINSETVSGYWIRESEFTSENYGKNQFYTPKKKYWPVDPQLNTTWSSYKGILKQIKPLLEAKFAPLLWMKTSRGTFERFFVVWW